MNQNEHISRLVELNFKHNIPTSTAFDFFDSIVDGGRLEYMVTPGSSEVLVRTDNPAYDPTKIEEGLDPFLVLPLDLFGVMAALKAHLSVELTKENENLLHDLSYWEKLASDRGDKVGQISNVVQTFAHDANLILTK